jgi:hypothetical protein
MIRYKYFFESFDKVSDLLSDPRNNERTVHELLDEFQSNGGKILGNGKFATVLFPSWKFVVKIFSDDTPYLKFVRFCLNNPRPSYPKFFDKPRRIIPNYKRHRSNNYLYVVKTEKLNPINIREFDDMQYFLSYDKENAEQMVNQYPDNQTWMFIYNKLIKLETDKPWLPQFKSDYNFVMNSSHEIGTPDITSKNIMKRDDGLFVLADPFWVGETPYQTHDRLLKAEIDYDDDVYYTEKDMVKGGEKWKPTKPEKPSMTPNIPSSPDNDVPFE